MEDIKEYDAGNMLWKIVCADRKVAVSQLQSVDVCAVIDDAVQKNIGLREGCMLLLALAKINMKRMRLLHDDCSRVYQLISRDKHVAVRSFRIPSDKPITLGVENGNLYINDEMVEFDAEMLVPREEFSLIGNETGAGALEPDFAEFSSIEQVRESTLISGSVVVPDGSIFAPKRRRTLEDRISEYDLDYFKSNMRAVRDIVNKIKRRDLKDGLRLLIVIDPKILSLLSLGSESRAEEVEMQRLSSFGGDFADNDFSIEPAAGHATVQSQMTERASESEVAVLFDRANLPSRFEFQTVVEGYTRFERAGCFSRLLSLVSSGEFEVQQGEPFGRIVCELVSNA